MKKERNTPKNEILTKDVNEAWKIQKHNVKARTQQILFKDTLFEN